MKATPNLRASTRTVTASLRAAVAEELSGLLDC